MRQSENPRGTLKIWRNFMPAFMKKFFDMLSPADSEEYDEVDENISEGSKNPEVQKNSKVINRE